MGAFALWWFLPSLLAPQALRGSWRLCELVGGLQVLILCSADDLGKSEPCRASVPLCQQATGVIDLGGMVSVTWACAQGVLGQPVPCWKCQTFTTH